jgi:hypothetical protein
LNYGTYGNSFIPVKKELSLSADFHYSLPQHPSWQLKAYLAGDFGNMYGPNFGLLLGIVKTGNF